MNDYSLTAPIAPEAIFPEPDKKDMQAVGTVTQITPKQGKTYSVTAVLTPDDETEVVKEYHFKKPTAPSYDRYIKTAGSGMSRALKNFMFDCVLEDSREALTQDLEEYPALAISIGEKLLSMLGLAKDVNLRTL
ncbi:DUF6848 family protein [Hungatella effluvii]|uniref:DUF6848 family protein n=1 Tax=Hungatella effluvii TaxID=1096246 RepID=UPI0022E769B0|nr:hypothetical protein [Hungatella effluvii]